MTRPLYLSILTMMATAQLVMAQTDPLSLPSGLSHGPTFSPSTDGSSHFLGDSIAAGMDATSPKPAINRQCDPAWDGLLWGVLPGLLGGTIVGMFIVDEGTTNTGRNRNISIVMGGLVGAATGLVLDLAQCND